MDLDNVYVDICNNRDSMSLLLDTHTQFECPPNFYLAKLSCETHRAVTPKTIGYQGEVKILIFLVVVR